MYSGLSIGLSMRLKENTAKLLSFFFFFFLILIYLVWFYLGSQKVGIFICVCLWSYHWIRRKGKPAPRETAPIVVSNHVSYIEPIFYFYELFPTIVAADSHDSIPFVGTIIRAMQVISFPRSLKYINS